MRIVTALIFVGLLLISSASAAGNDLVQRNTQDASSSGVFIHQDATNMGIMVGDGNTMIQKNEQNADASGEMSAIFQEAANLGIQVGHGNDMFQKNEADVDIANLEIGSATATLKKVLIVQVQRNLGIQVGRGNDMFQKNEADAEVANVAVGIANAGADATATVDSDAILSKVAIFQLQKNLGIQVGRYNDMFQKNEADAEVANVAVAVARADSTNEIGYILNGEETPLPFSFVPESSASADAFAKLSKVAIEQYQANLGIQVGRGNDMFQKNEADADAENVAVASAGAFASNDAEFIQTGVGSGADYRIIVGQSASATASAGASALLRKAEIEQSQKNLGVQIGIKNDMSQRNEADADAENGAVASAGAFASNDMLVDQFALAETISNNGKATANANNYADVEQVVGSYASADASAVLSKAEIEQNQKNLGVQVGIKNDMSQRNEADAELENGAVASAGAFTSNDMAVDQDAIAGAESNDVWLPFIGWLRGKTATATAGNSLTFTQNADSDASASANARLSKVEIEQCQANLGVQVGIRNDMSQKNKAEAEMENGAAASAGAFAANDWSVEQDALANALAGNWPGSSSSATATTTAILAQIADSDASASSSAALGKAKIQQCQANLGIQVGFGNRMIQRNKADAELENGAAASAGAFAPNFQEEIERSAVKFTWPGETDSDTPQLSLTVPATSADTQSASATLSKIWVQQCQKNLGVQVGHNFLVQKNKDEGEIEQLAFNTVADLQKISLEQKEKNVMVQVGSSAVFQWNSQTDSPSVSDTHIDRSQSNALVDVSHI